ncbi:MAG TPA: Sec-independent protein translocase protein TatB [Alphaproteobacteria bacterium]
MFDLSWTELLFIGVAAIIFIGPKELPGALRTLGRMAGKARAMAREFQSNVEDMIREAELDDVKNQVQRLQSSDYTRELERTIDPKGEITAALTPPDLDAPSPAPRPATPAADTAPKSGPDSLPDQPAPGASEGPKP